MIEDDASLVARAVGGDRAAVDSLLRAHYDMVRAVCHRIVLNRSDADDATQQAMISLARALPRFDNRSKFSTWAYRIATNAAIDEVRRTRRRAKPTDDETLAVVAAPLGDVADGIISQIDLETALGQVSPEYRQVLVLRHVADLDYADIADTLGLPVGTVRSRLARGRSQLIALLGNQEAPGDRQTGAHTSHSSGEGGI